MNTVYVDGVNGSDTNPGTSTYPVATIGQANSIVASVPGATSVQIAVGTYAEAVATVKAGVTYKANGTVVIDGGGVRDGIAITHDNITVDGFEIANCVGALSATNVTNPVVRNTVAHDSSTGIVFDTCTNPTAQSLTAYNLAGAGGIRFTGGTGGVIEDCEAYACSTRGFHVIQQAGVMVRRNYSHDQTDAAYAYEIEVDADNAQVYDNWASACVHGFIFKDLTGGICRGNVAWNIHTGDGFYSKNADDIDYQYNTAYDCTVGFEINHDPATTDPSTGNVIKNNIIAACTTYGLSVANGSDTGLVSDYNDYYGNATDVRLNSTSYALANWKLTGQDAHSVAVDPAYVDMTYGGFALPAGSSLLTAGEAGSAIGRDGA